jgi:hypothetical protein
LLPPKVEVRVPLPQQPFGKAFGIKGPAGETRFLVEFASNRPSQPG